MDARSVLGMVLLCIQAVIVIPLVIELRKTRSAEGISIMSEVAWIVAGMGWSLYGLMSGSPTLIVSGFLATLGSAVVYGLVRQDIENDVLHRTEVFGLVFVIVMGLSAMLFGVVGLGVFLSVFGLLQFLPQLRVSLGSIVRRDAVGVPLMGTGLRSLYTLSWSVYAGAWGLWGLTVADVDWPLAVWGLCGFVSFGLQFMSGVVARKS